MLSGGLTAANALVYDEVVGLPKTNPWFAIFRNLLFAATGLGCTVGGVILIVWGSQAHEVKPDPERARPKPSGLRVSLPAIVPAPPTVVGGAAPTGGLVVVGGTF